MSIVIPPFENREIEIKETYIDEQGRERERVRKVLLPVSKPREKDEMPDDGSKE